MEKKLLDLLIILVLFSFFALISLFFNLKPLTGAVLYILIPSIYLMFRERKNYKKIFIAVFLIGGIFGFVFDFIETFNKAWIVDRLVFPWKVFGILPVDDIIGFLLMTLFIIVFYEHFLDDEKNKKISPYLIFALAPSLLITFAMVVVFLIEPGFLQMPYAYFYGGLIAISFPIIYTFSRPHLLSKFLKIAAFFFIIWFVSEIVAIKTGGWYFPGNYIGNVSVFGVSFPFEELFFWMMFYAASIAAYYEKMVDDER